MGIFECGADFGKPRTDDEPTAASALAQQIEENSNTGNSISNSKMHQSQVLFFDADDADLPQIDADFLV